jgi:hypothetical protein
LCDELLRGLPSAAATLADYDAAPLALCELLYLRRIKVSEGVKDCTFNVHLLKLSGCSDVEKERVVLLLPNLARRCSSGG